MNIKIHVIGKLKDDYLKVGVSDYLKKISKYANIEIIEYKDVSIDKNPSISIQENIKDEECDSVLRRLKPSDYLITLDLNKKEYSSEEFASLLTDSFDKGGSTVHFMIGGSLGLSKKAKERSNLAISLSKMTFLHGMSRLILLEQIYRAFKINNNEVYHK